MAGPVFRRAPVGPDAPEPRPFAGPYTTDNLADGTVTTAKLAASAVTSAKIADATIVAGDLADNAVTTAKITDANVTLAKLAAEAWTAYTPSLTNASLGNGTVEGRYVQIGKTIHFWARLTAGTTTSISGTLGLSLPVSGRSPVINSLIRTVVVDAGSFVQYEGGCATTTGRVDLYVYNVGATYATLSAVNGTVPMTVANTDTYTVAGTYEAA